MRVTESQKIEFFKTTTNDNKYQQTKKLFKVCVCVTESQKLNFLKQQHTTRNDNNKQQQTTTDNKQ